MNAGSKLPCDRGVDGESRCLPPGGDKRGGKESWKFLILSMSRFCGCQSVSKSKISLGKLD